MISAAFNHLDITTFKRCFPTSSYSSYLTTTPIDLSIFSVYSLFPSMMALDNLMMGSMMN